MKGHEKIKIHSKMKQIDLDEISTKIEFKSYRYDELNVQNKIKYKNEKTFSSVITWTALEQNKIKFTVFSIKV